MSKKGNNSKAKPQRSAVLSCDNGAEEKLLPEVEAAFTPIQNVDATIVEAQMNWENHEQSHYLALYPISGLDTFMMALSRQVPYSRTKIDEDYFLDFLLEKIDLQHGKIEYLGLASFKLLTLNYGSTELLGVETGAGVKYQLKSVNSLTQRYFAPVPVNCNHGIDLDEIMQVYADHLEGVRTIDMTYQGELLLQNAARFDEDTAELLNGLLAVRNIYDRKPLPFDTVAQQSEPEENPSKIFSLFADCDDEYAMLKPLITSMHRRIRLELLGQLAFENRLSMMSGTSPRSPHS